MANRLNVLIGATLRSSTASDLNKELKELSKKIDGIKVKISFGKDFTDAIKTITKGFNKARASSQGLNTSVVNTISRVRELRSEVNQLASSLSAIRNTRINISANADSADRTNSISSGDSFRQSERELRKLQQKWADTQANLERRMENSIINLRSRYGDAFDEDAFRDIYNINDRIEDLLSRQNTTWADIRREIDACTGEARIFQSTLAAANRTDNNIERQIQQQTDLQRRWADTYARMQAQMENSIVSLRSRYSGSFDESAFRSLYNNLSSRVLPLLQRQDATWADIRREIDDCNGEVRLFQTNLTASVRQARELNSQTALLNSTLGRFTQFYGLGEVFRGFKTAVVDIAQNIREIDTAMVELKKVTDETAYTYENFLDGSADKAKELGITMTDYINAVTNFARMDVGGFEAAQQVAEVANIFQQVSENLTADQSSEYLISTMKAFGYEANNAIEIVDVLNNLSNKYAINIDGLGESLKRSSAAMKAANNTLEETAALTIAANNVIQDPKTVGNALKTVSINYLVA